MFQDYGEIVVFQLHLSSSDLICVLVQLVLGRCCFRTEMHVSGFSPISSKYLFLLKIHSSFAEKLGSELTNIKMLGTFLLEMLNFVYIQNLYIKGS